MAANNSLRRFLDDDDSYFPEYELAKRYNPGQPRHPKGDPKGGQFASKSGSAYPGMKATDMVDAGVVNTLGPEGVNRVKKLVEDEDATVDEVMKELSPANAEADSRPHTLGDDATGIPDGRTYVGGRTLDENVDHLEAVAKNYAEGNVAYDGEVTLVIGAPAAGKSTSAETLARRQKAAILDSDDAKKTMVEFDGGIGASAVHVESQFLAGKVEAHLVKQKANIVHPIVGHNPAKLRKTVSRFEAAGYKVNLVHVDVTPERAAKRMANRYLRTGRLINTDYFSGIGNKPARAFDELIRDGSVRNFARIDANGSYGSERVTSTGGSIPGLGGTGDRLIPGG